MLPLEPFRQLALSDLPVRPLRSHRYFELEVRETLVTCAWGTSRVHVRVTGSGPPLLLIHGLMTAGYSWRYVLDQLGDHFTLYIPDLPGSGRTERTRLGYRPSETGQWLSGLVDALGIRGCACIGNSMGGYLAMVWALQDPDALGRLVNLHGPGFPEARLYLLRGLLAIPGTRRLLRALVHSNPRRWVQKNVHYYDESLKSLEELDEYAEPLADREGIEAFARILSQTMDPVPMRAFIAELRRRPFPVPLQLVYAAEDPVVPPSFGPRFAKLLPGAELVVLPRGSHFAHVDAVDLFVPAVLPFLGGHLPPAQ